MFLKASRSTYNANVLNQRQVVPRNNPENVKILEKKQSKKPIFLIIQNQRLTFSKDTVHTANTFNLSRSQIGLINTRKKTESHE